MEGHPIPAPAEIKRTPIQRGYDAFSAFQERLAANVLARSPQEIAQIAYGETPLEPFIEEMLPKNNPQLVLRGERGAQAASFLRTYAQRESAIQSWWEEKTAGQTEMQQKREILALTKYAKEHDISDEVLEKVTLTRIHGGIGFVIEDPTLMRQLGIVAAEEVYQRDETAETPLSLHTTKVTDPEQVDEALGLQGEIGFVLDDSELSLPEGLAGMKIVFGTKNAMAHEEAEILGMYMDEALEGMKGLKQLSEQRATERSSFQPTEQTRLALFDMAARLEEGVSDLNLPLLGITPAYAQSHEQEAKLLAIALEHVQQKVQEARENGTSPKEVKTQLAHEIRGAIIHPESLLSLWHPDANAEELLSQQHLTPEHFLGIQDTSYAFTSERKGRFVYYNEDGSLLKEAKLGDPLVEQVNSITIEGKQFRILKRMGGGFGHVYKAQDTATNQIIILKEAVFDTNDKWIGYVFSETQTEQGAKKVLDQWSQEQRNAHASDPSFTPDPFDFLLHIRDLAHDGLGELDAALQDAAASSGLHNLQVTLPGIGTVPLLDPKALSINPTLIGKTTSAEVRACYQQVEEAILKGIVDFSNHPRIKAIRENMDIYDTDLYREGEIQRSLDGIPGIPKYFGWRTGKAGKDPSSSYYNNYYLAMEYIHGETLRHELSSRKKPYTAEQTLQIAAQITTTLAEVHKRGILVRDLKPENIMLGQNGQVYLIDVGIAVARANSAIGNTIQHPGPLPAPLQGHSLITPNYIDKFGTDTYVPPEQYRTVRFKTGSLQEPTDIYPLSMIMLDMLDPRPNRAPWPSEKDIRSRLHRKVPQDVLEIIIKAASLDASSRYKDADEMHADIMAALSKLTPATPQPATPPPPPPPPAPPPPPLRAAAPTVQLQPLPPTTQLPSPRQQALPVAQALIQSLDHASYPTPVRSLQTVPADVVQALNQITALPADQAIEALDTFGDKASWKSPDMRDIAPFIATQRVREVMQQTIAAHAADPRIPLPDAHLFGLWGRTLGRALDSSMTFTQIHPTDLANERTAFFQTVNAAVKNSPQLASHLIGELTPLLSTPWITKDRPEDRKLINQALAQMLYTAAADNQPINDTWLDQLEESITATAYPEITSSYSLPVDVRMYMEALKVLSSQTGGKPKVTARLTNLMSTASTWQEKRLTQFLPPVLTALTSSI